MEDIYRKVNKGEPSVFAVMYMTGEYEDKHTGIECVYESEEDAVAFVTEKKQWQDRVEEIAIKDKACEEYGFYYHDPNRDGGCEYSDLEQAYNEEVWKELFGDRKEDELSDEEYSKYDVALCENYEEKFRNFLIKKGYSEEVVDATIAYHGDEYSSDYKKWYHIEEVPYQKKL